MRTEKASKTILQCLLVDLLIAVMLFSPSANDEHQVRRNVAIQIFLWPYIRLLFSSVSMFLLHFNTLYESKYFRAIHGTGRGSETPVKTHSLRIRTTSRKSRMDVLQVSPVHLLSRFSEIYVLGSLALSALSIYNLTIIEQMTPHLLGLDSLEILSSTMIEFVSTCSSYRTSPSG